MAAFSTVLICVASATRVGYVIYPLNFALWSCVCARRARTATRELAERRLDRRGVLVDPKGPVRSTSCVEADGSTVTPMIQ